MEENKKKNKVGLYVIILGVLLIIGGSVYTVLGTDTFKEKKNSENNQEENNNNNNNNNNEKNAGIAEKFEGIYQAQDDKMFIHKGASNDELLYMIADSFQGKAKIIDEKTAQAEDYFGKDEYFIFKLVDNGIEVDYHSGDDVLVSAETGLYTKMSDYSKENIYKTIIGDVSYLNSNYSGLYSNDEFEMYVIQKDENNIYVRLKSGDNTFGLFFDEEFVIQDNNKLVSYSFFDEKEIDYEITFNDKQFSIVVHDDVFGVDEEDKKFEGNYKYIDSITQDEVLDEFYSNY